MDKNGLTDAEVLMVLYNRAKAQGMGLLHYEPRPMTLTEAEEIVLSRPKGVMYFDYLKGRVIKTDVSENPLDLRLYNRDNGPAAGENAILDYAAKLRRA